MSPVRQRQGGAIAIMYALMLPAILGCVGLALDLGACYLRRAQLQNAADSIALAAAGPLNGTAAGVTAAADRALRVAFNLRLGLTAALPWNGNALTFASRPDAPATDWLAAGALGAAAATVRYARVDTSQLGVDVNNVQPALLGILGFVGTIDVAAVAVAGPAALQVTPLAVCALSTTATATRANPGYPELVRFGFRAGVGYNLLNLNPTAATPGEYFYVDPMHVAGAGAANVDEAAVAPFMCTGTVGYPTFVNGSARLLRPAAFNLAPQLNSRFGTYGGTPACNPLAAPPDTNIKSYAGANATWLTRPPTRLTALPSTATGQLRTIADTPPVVPPTALVGDYGILWAYGPARSSTGGNLSATAFPTLYPATPAGSIRSSGPSYPLTGPYQMAGANFGTAPTALGRASRRVLHIPLLRCPVAAGTLVQGDVLAIGSFLLTAPASATEVPAEFIGIDTDAALPATMGLHL